MKQKKIGLLSSSRADYGIYSPLIEYWKNQRWLELERIIFGAHLLDGMELFLKQIEEDCYGIVHKVGSFQKTNSSKEVVKTYAEVVKTFSSFWELNKYDCLISLGDRFEMSAAIQSAIPFHIPIAHIHGGETTLGSIDNIYRHQITIASQLHFTSTENYRLRVTQIKGSDNNVYNVGSLSLSELKDNSSKLWESIASKYNIPKEPFIIITIHPETNIQSNFRVELEELSKVLKDLVKRYHLIITGTNSDQNHKSILDFFEGFYKLYPNQITIINSLGRENYFSALHNCSFVMGNSSSGIIEAASFGKFVIDLGNRQNGRLKSNNTFTIPFESKSIIEKINTLERKGLEYKGDNIYFKESVSENITMRLKNFLQP